MKERNYKKEYADYHGKPEQISNRAKRNSARSAMEDNGQVRKGDGNEVDHKKPLSKGGGNSTKNLQVLTRNENRAKGALTAGLTSPYR